MIYNGTTIWRTMKMTDDEYAQQLDFFNQQQSYRQTLIEEDDKKEMDSQFRKAVEQARNNFGDTLTLDTLVDIVLKREKNTMKLYDLWTELEREVEDRSRPNLSAW